MLMIQPGNWCSALEADALPYALEAHAWLYSWQSSIYQ